MLNDKHKQMIVDAFRKLDPGFTLDGERQPFTHDYTDATRGYGHDYSGKMFEGGLKGKLTGWGYGIQVGDFLILSNGTGTTRYKVTAVTYLADPKDMWHCDVEFAPRNSEEKGEE